MRVNEPVTQNEYLLADNATLMSTTDVQSHIKYANAAFVEASGFSAEEVRGQPHNLVRHPDMPKEAFADMWSTLKAGEPWTALVKNRRKNGDHYWVRANAVPIVRDGKHTGYMSVRTKPTRVEVNDAEKLYKAMREGTSGQVSLHKGILIKRGIWGVLSRFRLMGVRNRIRLNLFALWVVLSAAILLITSVLSHGIALVALVTVGLSALCYLLEIQIAKPLEQLRQQALDVATGNNRNAVQMNRVDEIGMAMRSISQVGLMFRWLIDDVSEQVMSVRRAVDNIVQGNNNLSARTEQSASSIEETVASMEEMTVAVKNNADAATRANVLSGEASKVAADGGQAMDQVVATMGGITASAKKISDIIGVIDGIAFQTNILALNAAVEAARAGEQGRGFAVVASEVRNLAQRSASAAKEIKELIDDSVNQVATGSKLVDDTGRAIANIVEQTKRVSNLLAEISSATREQSTGISQVSGAVAHMDQITQQNAALVEESAAASTSLNQQTQQLVEAINVFL